MSRELPLYLVGRGAFVLHHSRLGRHIPPPSELETCTTGRQHLLLVGEVSAEGHSVFAMLCLPKFLYVV